MRFAHNCPWLCLVEPWVLMNVETWLSHSDSWNCSDGSFGPVVGINPCYIILPDILDIVMDVPVMLTREAVVMGIYALCNPPFPLDISNTSKILLSIVLSNSTSHIRWLRWLAAVLEYALSHSCESRKIRILSDFTVKVTTKFIFPATYDTGQ